MSQSTDPFLSLVARDLYSRYGNDLSRVALVFPNKRASLFFNDYLAACSEIPVWAPSYLTISELMESLSDLQLADPIKMVCELHRIFCRETGSRETLDEFYFWGELLIRDFDDLDKNRVDAERLFTNLNDLKQIMEVPDYLTPEQEEAIRLFFHNFSLEKQTELKARFLSLWEVLGDVYVHFRNRLEEQGIGYEGMLYRRVVENLDLSDLEHDCYVFVGFNVLNRVEHALFSCLKNAEKALFYWDYDVFYTGSPEQEAGEFMNRNLKDFPSPLEKKLFNRLGTPKKVRCIAATTENAQARYMAEWTAHCPEGPERENAIVLCDESLLLPVYHALSPQVKHVNVTMGFPLQQTPVVSFLQALLELQLNGYDAESGSFRLAPVLAVLRHSYFRQLSTEGEALSEELQRELRLFPLPSELQKDEISTYLFTPCTTHLELIRYLMENLRRVAAQYQEGPEEETVCQSCGLETEGHKSDLEKDFFYQLYREALFKAYTTLQRIEGLIETGDLVVGNATLSALVSRLLASLSVPFHGEPAIGLQVMGVLETRNLDFRRLAVLSLGEGLLPKASDTASFIPYNLRRAFGMTTVAHTNSVYAYYFYRLLQRAEDITLLYNHFSDGLHAREWSRFLIQFLVEWSHPVERYSLVAPRSLNPVLPLRVEKDDLVYERMLRSYDTRYRTNAYFSASALNSYLDCRLKFYLKYVAGLTVPAETTADIDAALFGSLFHRVAEEVYTGLAKGIHGVVSRESLEEFLKSPTALELLLKRVFNELLFHPRPGEQPVYNGLQLIHRKVIARYIRRLLRYDARQAPFVLEGAEVKVREAHTVFLPGGGSLSLRVGGTIDRIDRRGNALHVVDYKTGGLPQKTVSVEELFTPSEKRPGYIFQTFLYSSLLLQQERECGKSTTVVPCLLYIHKAASEDYSPYIELGETRKKERVTDISLYEKEFRERLDALLGEIFDRSVPFTQTEFPTKCEHCEFRQLCKR